jgi:hypothetical protein
MTIRVLLVGLGPIGVGIAAQLLARVVADAFSEASIALGPEGSGPASTA